MGRIAQLSTRIIAAVFLLLLSTTVFCANQKYFLSLSDIHFDPFIACYNKSSPCPMIQHLREAPANAWPRILSAEDQTEPQYRLDTNYPLLKSSLVAANKAAKENQVQFVLVLGDFLGHDFRKYYKKYTKDFSQEGYQSFLNKTLQFLTNEISASFPSLNVYAAVGNNDTYGRDYSAIPSGQFFQDVSSMWGSLIRNKNSRKEMESQFSKAGYYATQIPENKNLKLIILNSVLFSYKAIGKNIDEAAMKQLDWLHQQLEEAKSKNQKVLIAMHIPVGIDVYATMRLRLFTLIHLWKPKYTERYKSELNEFHEEIMGVFSGHLHSDWFQILTVGNQNEIAVTGTPSISPIFGNNPGFKIYKYSTPDDNISDYYTYFFPINDKKRWGLEYEFNRIYQPNCSMCSIMDGMKLLHQSGELADRYKKYYSLEGESKQILTMWNSHYQCFINSNEKTKCYTQSGVI